MNDFNFIFDPGVGLYIVKGRALSSQGWFENSGREASTKLSGRELQRMYWDTTKGNRRTLKTHA